MSKSFLFLIKLIILLIPALWLAFNPGRAEDYLVRVAD